MFTGDCFQAATKGLRGNKHHESRDLPSPNVAPSFRMIDSLREYARRELAWERDFLDSIEAQLASRSFLTRGSAKIRGTAPRKPGMTAGACRECFDLFACLSLVQCSPAVPCNKRPLSVRSEHTCGRWAATPRLMPITEHSINDALAAVLRTTRRAWSAHGVVRSENNGILKHSAKRPDILVTEPYVSPAVIETEVVPAVNAGADAEGNHT